MTHISILLIAVLGLAACRDAQPKQSEVQVAEATPKASNGGTAKAADGSSCFDECVMRNQMRAEAAEQIEADCRTECEGAPETAEPALTFKPVKIPGTPHDEEGTMITLTWAADSGEVGLFESAGVTSRAMAKLELEKGAELAYEDSVVLVTEGTALTATKDEVALTSASGFAPETGALTDASRDENVTAGDKVWMLKYAGEGTCYMQLNDSVYLANCPNDEFEPGDRKPQASEWWVLMKGEGGSGWLKVDDRVKVETKSSM